MRIAIFHQYAYTPSHTASTRHYELARELIGRGHQVEIVAGGFDHKNRRETKSYGKDGFCRENIGGVTYTWIKTLGYRRSGLRRFVGMIVFYFRCRAMVRKGEFADSTVALGSSPSPFAAMAASYVASQLKIPFVLEVRDLWPLTLRDIGGLSKRHPIYIVFFIIEKFLYRRAETIISTLPNGREHFEEVAGKHIDVRYIPNGARIDLTNKSTCSVLPKKKYFSVVYAGALGKSNDIDTIIFAAKNLVNKKSIDGKEIRFFFYGEGEEKARLKALVSGFSLSNVYFKDPVPKSEIRCILDDADCCVASVTRASVYKYGISLNKINDYFSAARPVVISSNSVNNPVIDSGAGYSVDAGDFLGMAQAVEKIALMPVEKRCCLGERGRAYAEREHNFVVLGERLEGVLKEVLSLFNNEKSGSGV